MDCNCRDVTYNYNKLLGKIKEMFGTQEKFASSLGISSRALTQKLKGQRMFKQTEISRACNVLEIDEQEIPAYFFAQ